MCNFSKLFFLTYHLWTIMLKYANRNPIIIYQPISFRKISILVLWFRTKIINVVYTFHAQKHPTHFNRKCFDAKIPNFLFRICADCFCFSGQFNIPLNEKTLSFWKVTQNKKRPLFSYIHPLRIKQKIEPQRAIVMTFHFLINNQCNSWLFITKNS